MKRFRLPGPLLTLLVGGSMSDRQSLACAVALEDKRLENAAPRFREIPEAKATSEDTVVACDAQTRRGP